MKLEMKGNITASLRDMVSGCSPFSLYSCCNQNKVVSLFKTVSIFNESMLQNKKSKFYTNT